MRIWSQLSRKSFFLKLLVLSIPIVSCGYSQNITDNSDQIILSVADFLPVDYIRDGSVSYQKEVQRALDTAVGKNAVLTFPPIVYLLDEKGLQLHSSLTLIMHGAVFQLREDCDVDGQAFFGKDLHRVRLLGGEIGGTLGIWPEGVNIRGIYITGASENIHIRDMYIHDLTSNAIGVFGTEKTYARDIWIIDVIAEDGCNYYGDYLSNRPGTEEGSLRQDQGLVAFYYVKDFTVRGCRFERSRSDGTHFYKCKQGQFVQNKVYGAQMGGYFLEGCENVTASDNIIRDNGSRGCTIERGSRNCLLRGNVVTNSGREGLWAPNCIGLIVTGNIFDRNGRKPNGTGPNQIWNANITVNEAHDPTKTLTQDYLISDNIFYTSDTQIAAIRIDATKVKGIVVKDNQFRGENDLVLVEGEKTNNVRVMDNE